MIKGFKDFILRGNVIDLAVAVVMGAAFGAVVTALVKDLLTPLITAVVGKPSFQNLDFRIHGSTFQYGDFLNALISFLMVGAAIYFAVVLPMKAVMDRMKKPDAPAAPSTKTCPECMSEIPLEARRCKFCTSQLKSA
jgi:large conductance mechanosensitive channel